MSWRRLAAGAVGSGDPDCDRACEIETIRQRDGSGRLRGGEWRRRFFHSTDRSFRLNFARWGKSFLRFVSTFSLFLALLLPVAFLGHREANNCEKLEQIRPNLILDLDSHIHGRVTDAKDVPLKNSRVELRRYISEKKQVLLKGVNTDENGVFELGKLDAGKYRLLASPTRAFKQPGILECFIDECDFDIVLQPNEGEAADSGCPIR